MRFYSVLILAVAALLISVAAQAEKPEPDPIIIIDESDESIKLMMSAADFDDDGVINQDDNCIEDFNPDQFDFDEDGVGDACDNCTVVANSGQEDANGDGFGNRCDADLDDDLIVGIPDFTLFINCLNAPGQGVGHRCKIADFDSDNTVGSMDFQLFEAMFQLPPGPSALAP